jgi:hypothetical protein
MNLSLLVVGVCLRMPYVLPRHVVVRMVLEHESSSAGMHQTEMDPLRAKVLSVIP